MANQVAGYEVTKAVVEDGTLPCLRAKRPERLGQGAPVTVWILGPVARLAWTAAKARISSFAAVRGAGLPAWIEAGIGERDQRPVIFVSAEVEVAGTLASAPAELDVPARLRALARAARGAHVLHEHGLIHAAICPQVVALCEDGTAVLGPPALADGTRLLAQVGYPPLGYIDPQLLRGSGGRWSDIWALGATAHYVVTGMAPFQGLDDVPVVDALSRQLASPPPALAPLPAAVAEIVGRCLAVDPAVRPQTAAEVADTLEQAAAQLTGAGPVTAGGAAGTEAGGSGDAGGGAGTASA